MRCPECGKEIDIDLKDENMFYLPDCEPFILPTSGLTVTIKNGKMHLSGDGLTPKLSKTEPQK